MNSAEKAYSETQLIDGDTIESCYKQVEPEKKPEEKPKDQPQGRSQIKFVRETRNAIRVVRHPSEELYVEASPANDGRVTLLNEP